MRKLFHFLLPAPFLVFASHVLPARQSAPAPQTASPVPLERVYQAFVGNWTGELEYRDYQSDQHVKLPTWLDVTVSPDGRGLQFHYLYDEGPNKVVEEVSAVTIDPQMSCLRCLPTAKNPRKPINCLGSTNYPQPGQERCS